MDAIPILIDKLARLSDPALEESARRFARREKRNGAAVIAHLAEISRRDLHLKLGYRDLFEYVEDRLGFHGSSAGLRIHVAKKARDFPQLLDALWREELCLSGASLLAPHLTEENVERLVSASAGRSTRGIKETLRGIAPLAAYEPGIRKRPKRALAERPVQAEGSRAGSLGTGGGPLPRPGMASAELRAEGGACDGVTAPAPVTAVTAAAREVPLSPVLDPHTVGRSPAAPRRPSNVLEAATPATYNFRFSADKSFRDKLERLAEVLRVGDPVRNMGSILEKAVDCLLEREDPRRCRALACARACLGGGAGSSGGRARR